MTNDHECQKCYKKTVERIREYLNNQCKDGESISVEVYGSYGRDCYISVSYDTIIDKKHVSKSEHLPPYLMGAPFVIDCLPTLMDCLLKYWRKPLGDVPNLIMIYEKKNTGGSYLL